jgi:hypothetical protein
MVFLYRENQGIFGFWHALPASARQQDKSFLLLFFKKEES